MNGLKIEAPLRNKKCRHQPRFKDRGRRLQSLCWRGVAGLLEKIRGELGKDLQMHISKQAEKLFAN